MPEPRLSAAEVIQRLGLTPLPLEGGFYRETYRAAESLPAAALPARYGQDRPAGTAIYYFLHGAQVSALHRLRTDEVYHFYLGDPVEMLLLHPEGRWESRRLGPDLAAGQHVQSVAPRGVWQGSRLRPGGQYALLGTTMAPGWDPADFELGDPAALSAQYPAAAALIRALAPAP